MEIDSYQYNCRVCGLNGFKLLLGEKITIPQILPIALAVV